MAGALIQARMAHDDRHIKRFPVDAAYLVEDHHVRVVRAD
jgi:hypothetical protein